MVNQIIERLKSEFKGKKVLIVGLGLQGGGAGLIKFFAKLGADVRVTDKKNKEELASSLEALKDFSVKYTLGEHKLGDFLEVDIIFKGPSVPWDLPELVEAQKRNIPVEMELSFFASQLTTKNVIGVTGTRGKSTTTYMIYEVLKNAGYDVLLGGNIPNISTISLLETISDDQWVLLELPSWPLSGFHRKKISPHIAVFTNFYPDHLNYYRSMSDYLWDKKAIYLYQTQSDYLVANKNLKEIIEKDNVRSQINYFSNDFKGELNYLQGNHNLENACTAYKVAEIMKIDLIKASAVISNFRGLPYRQQIIKEKDGIIFVNDTTSTTPVACEKAIETFYQNGTVLILGGNSKNLPFDSLIDNLSKVNKMVLLKGNFTDLIYPILQKKYPEKISKIFSNFEEAVNEAYIEAKELKKEKQKVVILFSPGATSFSLFNNEFHRGKEFNRIVKELV